MDRRERAGDPQSAMLVALQGWQAGLWTAMPVQVESYDASKRTVSLQPMIKSQMQVPDGSFQWVTLPLLVDCPVVFPSGGGVTLTFPIKQGDEGLVIFASRCIDAWWQNGGLQIQPELRMHDLSDGIYLPGISSVPKVIPAISTTTAQLRNDAGTVIIELDPTGAVNVATSGAVTLTAAGGVTINGSLHVTGDVTGDGEITAGSIPLSTHIHDRTKPSVPGDHSGTPLP